MDPVPVTAAVQLLSVDVNGTFSITPEAESVLKGLEGPFYTVVLHGHARSGKSTLLTLLVREWFRNTPHADAAASFRFFVKTSPETASSDSGTQHGSGSRTLIKCAQWFTALRWYDADGSFRATVLLIDSEAGVYQGTVFAGFLAAQIQAVAHLQSNVLIVRPDAIPSSNVQDSTEQLLMGSRGTAVEQIRRALPPTSTAPKGTHTMIALKDMEMDRRRDRQDSHRPARENLLASCGPEVRRAVKDPADVFLFGAPLCLTPEDFVWENDVVDYAYPDRFSEDRFVEVMARMVRRLRAVLDTRRPVRGNGTVMIRRLWQIVGGVRQIPTPPALLAELARANAESGSGQALPHIGPSVPVPPATLGLGLSVGRTGLPVPRGHDSSPLAPRIAMPSRSSSLPPIVGGVEDYLDDHNSMDNDREVRGARIGFGAGAGIGNSQRAAASNDRAATPQNRTPVVTTVRAASGLLPQIRGRLWHAEPGPEPEPGPVPVESVESEETSPDPNDTPLSVTSDTILILSIAPSEYPPRGEREKVRRRRKRKRRRRRSTLLVGSPEAEVEAEMQIAVSFESPVEAPESIVGSPEAEVEIEMQIADPVEAPEGVVGSPEAESAITESPASPIDTLENIVGSSGSEAEAKTQRAENSVDLDTPGNVMGLPEPEPELEMTERPGPPGPVDTPQNIVESLGSEAEAETQIAQGPDPERSVDTPENIVGSAELEPEAEIADESPSPRPGRPAATPEYIVGSPEPESEPFLRRQEASSSDEQANAVSHFLRSRRASVFRIRLYHVHQPSGKPSRGRVEIESAGNRVSLVCFEWNSSWRALLDHSNSDGVPGERGRNLLVVSEKIPPGDVLWKQLKGVWDLDVLQVQTDQETDSGERLAQLEFEWDGTNWVMVRNIPVATEREGRSRIFRLNRAVGVGPLRSYEVTFSCYEVLCHIHNMKQTRYFSRGLEYSTVA